MKKSFMAIFTAATIAISGLGSTMAYASVFADINSVPWPGAAQYIDEAYDLGLMAGYVENGKRYCKPKNNITYCEAAQLMYAIMSSYSGTSVSSSVVSKWTNVMASKNIPTWAYNAVAYSLENSILSQNDISIFMATSSKQNNARREDVAVIFGKALSKIHGLTSNPALSYADKSSIATTSVPYVELLNRLNIMIGDSNNKFNPKVNINRAEMSVIVSKTYNNLKGGSTGTTNPPTGTITQLSGTITSVKSTGTGSYAVSLKTDKGSSSVVANATTSVIGVDGGSSSITKLAEGDAVVAICSGSTATTIIVMSKGNGSTTPAAETFKGKINAISTDEISVKGDSKTKSFDISDDVTVKIDGSTSTLSKLISRFKGGYNYTVKVSLDDDDEVIAIEAKEGDSDSKLDDDAITKISNSKITLNNGDVLTLPDDTDEITVKIDGSTKDFEDLKDEFKALDDDEQMIVKDYKLDRRDELESIKVVIEDIKSSSKKEESDIAGVIDSISSSYVKVDGTKYYFPDDDDDVDMEYDDDDYDEISEFVDDVDGAIDDNDTVFAEIEMSGDEISKIVAYKCSTVEDEDIESVDTSDKEIEVDGDTYTYTSSTKFEIVDGNSKITTASKLYDAVDEDEKIITVTIAYNDDDELISVIGYVSEIGETEVKDFEYDDDNDAEENYIKLDNGASSVKYFFHKDFDVDDIESAYDEYDENNDNDDPTDVELELDEEGFIVEISIK